MLTFSNFRIGPPISRISCAFTTSRPIFPATRCDGAEVSVGVDSDGDIAIFSVSRDYFNIDAVEKALRVFVGDLKDEGMSSSPVVIIEKSESVSQKDQEDLKHPVKD